MTIHFIKHALQNPNVRGSGYIEHPPQVPFAGRVVMQPSTVNVAEEIPEWYVPGQQRPVGYQPQYQQHGVPQYHQQRPQPVQHHAPQPVQTRVQQPVKAPAPAASRPIQPMVRPTQHVPAAPVVQEEKKLSKAAKAKLRKKMREGKA
jgi:hypothetical protein